MRVSAYPAGSSESEARRAVDDGHIWPIQRDRMVVPQHITERMVEDIGALVNDGGEAAVVTLDDLKRQGWLPEQVQLFGVRAFALFEAAHRKPRRVTGNRSTVYRPRNWRNQAACLGLLAIPVALAARYLFAGMA